MTTNYAPPPGPMMTLSQFRDSLDAALAGALLSDNGASDEMLDRLADIAVSEPGSPERRAALSAARAQYRAEASYNKA